MSRFTYRGVDLSPFLNVLAIQRTVGNERAIETNAAPKIGVNVQEVKISAKIIKVRVSLSTKNLDDLQFVDTVEPAIVERQNINKLREKVAGILHVVTTGEPLELPDEPDMYYNAIPRGDIDLEGITDWYDETVIEFFIPDGVAHATAYRRFDTPREENGKFVFELENNGTVDAYPIITIKNNSENGYVGVVNQTNALEIGSREETDGKNVKKSEVLLDYTGSSGINKGFIQGQKNGAILNDGSQQLRGTLAIDHTWGRPHIALNQRGGTVGNNAGSITWEIPDDSSGQIGSLNEYFWWRQIFWVGAANQFGFIKVMVSDTQGRFLYGVETIKRASGLDVEYNLLASDGKGSYKIIKPWHFTGTHLEKQNPFNEARGWSDIQRVDDVLRVFWWGSYLEFRVPEIKGKKSAKIHVALGAFGDKPLVSHMYLDSFIYRKDFVDAFEDVPNRYRKGSNIVIDTEKDLVSVDNIASNNDVVDGSGWELVIPPGKSELTVIPSSWCKEDPTITVDIEERYL